MKLCLFASYTYKRKSIRVFRTPILVYLDVRGVEIPLLSTVSISNCRYQEAPGEVVWSDFLAQLPRRSIEILWHLTRPSGLVKCQRISILLLGNCARISQSFVLLLCWIYKEGLSLASKWHYAAFVLLLSHSCHGQPFVWGKANPATRRCKM